MHFTFFHEYAGAQTFWLFLSLEKKKRHPSWDQMNDTFKQAFLSHHQLREEMVNTQCHQETLSNSNSDEIHSKYSEEITLSHGGRYQE